MVHLVIPAAREGERGAGQWKDLQGIRLVLSALGADWREFRFNEINVGELAERIGGTEATVVWYYTFWPEAMEELKRRCPRARIVLRTVNAEALQHWTRAKKDWRKWRGLPRDAYGFLRLLARDWRCGRAADALAGISPWDDDRYWRRLAGRNKVRHVPYVSPWSSLRPETKPLAWERREDVVLCLAGTRDAIGRAHVAGFAALAVRPEFSGWRFQLSAGFGDDSRDVLPPAVERLGRIEDPWERLCRVKAVALLSPLGYGYKTTVADARAAGCHVLVHPRQHRRLPRDEQPFCISVDPADSDDVRRAVARLASPAVAGEAGAGFDRAAAAWKGALSP
ncbi:MAG: hypothetical protein EOL90_07805 [Spartobacteria bacterium]|nr:hypothetical protein [Spartobacteria bacterium]